MSRFGHNFRNAFNSKYYEQLKEETFKFKRVTPREYINHLEKEWVKLDILVVKRLRAKFLSRWQDVEHIISFRVRVIRVKKMYAEFSKPVIIKDKDICQHYLEEMLARTDLFGEKCITKWNKKKDARKTWPQPAAYFEKRVKEMKKFETMGGKVNEYVTANAAMDLQEGLEATVAAAMSTANAEHALALSVVTEGFEAKMDSLTNALALLARVADKKNVTLPRKKRRCLLEVHQREFGRGVQRRRAYAAPKNLQALTE